MSETQKVIVGCDHCLIDKKEIIPIPEEARSPIVIGCDHAAFKLKETLKNYVMSLGINVRDLGAYSEESVDYPDVGIHLSHLVSTGQYKRGILLCGTGLGMSMVANKFPNVRAALVNDLFSAAMSRCHNDANVLVLGGRLIGDVLAKEIVKVWFQTAFDGGRHQKRIDKFNAVDPSKITME